MANAKKSKKHITPESVIVAGAFSALPGALVGGISGILGKTTLSFFSPAMASMAGSFATFAGIGAIAAPLTIIPRLIMDHFLQKSGFAAKHPYLHSFLQDTATLLLTLATVTAAAAILCTPMAPAIISMMIIPVAWYALSTICNVINACLYGKEEEPVASAVPTMS